MYNLALVKDVDVQVIISCVSHHHPTPGYRPTVVLLMFFYNATTLLKGPMYNLASVKDEHVEVTTPCVSTSPRHSGLLSHNCTINVLLQCTNTSERSNVELCVSQRWRFRGDHTKQIISPSHPGLLSHICTINVLLQRTNTSQRSNVEHCVSQRCRFRGDHNKHADHITTPPWATAPQLYHFNTVLKGPM